MVLRIIRRVCRPSKFRRPKHNALLERLKGTASGEQQNEVTGCKRCRGVNGSFGTQPNDPSNFKRPRLHIAFSTVFAEAKGDDKDSLTLLESLRQRLASHNISVEEPAKFNEAKEEISDETEEGRHEFSEDTIQVEESVRATPISDADNAKQPQYLEPGDERRSVFDPPHIKSYTRYLQQNEKQNEAHMFDELARKYLVTEKGEIDKPMSRDMERLGLPVNTSEAMRPPVNVYFSGEVESREQYAPKRTESAKTEAPVENSAYYEKANWCNKYFIDTPKETVLEIARVNKEMAEESADKFRRDTLHNDMLPLNWCYDSYSGLQNSDKEALNVAKVPFDKHDDMLAFHLLQCKEFVDLDLTVKTDPVESPVQELKVEENQPIHYNIPTSPITEFEATTKAAHPKESSDTILQIQSQTVSRTQKEQSSQQAEPLHYTNTAEAKVHEEGAYQTSQTGSRTVEEQSSQQAEPLLYTNTAGAKVHEEGAYQTSQTVSRTQEEQSSQQAEPLLYTNTAGAKVHEEGAYQTSQTVSRTQEEQSSQQAEPLLYTNIAGGKVHEEGAYQTSQTVSRTQEEQNSQQAEPLLYTNTAEAKVHEQGVYQTTNETDINILHMNSQRTKENQGQKGDEGNPLEHIYAKVLEPVQEEAAQKMEQSERSVQSPQNLVKPELFTESKMVGYNTTEEIDVSEKTKDYSPISQDARAVFDKAPVEPIDTTQDSSPTSPESQAIVQSLNQAHAEQTDESRSTAESLQSSQERQAIVPSYVQGHEQQIDTSKMINESAYYTKQSQAMIANSNQVQEAAETLKTQNVTAEEIQPTKGSEAMAQSCVQAQTAAGTEATNTAEPAAPNNVTTMDDALNKLNLDSNLSLSELLRRVRARNRLQYCNDIRTYMLPS